MNQKSLSGRRGQDSVLKDVGKVRLSALGLEYGKKKFRASGPDSLVGEDRRQIGAL